MPPSDASLASDLAGLPERARREIFDSLSVTERARASALLQPDAAQAAIAVEPKDPDFRHNLSPWLAARIEEAREAVYPPSGNPTMTPATLQLLLRIARDLSLGRSVAASAPTTRSLLSAISGFLWMRKARP